jgi:hypothetical protein
MSDSAVPIAGSTVVQAVIPEQAVGIAPGPARTRPPQYQQAQDADPSLPARTTFQEDLTTAGQRKVNLIWEYTQAAIAILVVLATLICGAIGMTYDLQVPTIISVAFGMVTGFYFSRTNHAAIGGVGAKPMTVPYTGR